MWTHNNSGPGSTLGRVHDCQFDATEGHRIFIRDGGAQGGRGADLVPYAGASSNRAAMPTIRRPLPIYPSPVTHSAAPIRVSPEDANVLRDAEKDLGLPVGDLIPVDLDDHIAFKCARSGTCCQGRHPLSNLVMPLEAAAMWEDLKQSGMTDIDAFVPGTLRRFIVAGGPRPRGARADQLYDAEDRFGGSAAIGEFRGLMFRLDPDESMPDGDRCQFLTGDAPGQYGCHWHGTRAQPLACALAPVGVFDGGDQAPILAVPKSRYAWCQGVRDMTDKGAIGFTVRDLLVRISGESRLAEVEAYGRAREASKGWRRGYRNHHSPLAKLYIKAIPELDSVLARY